MEQLKKYPHFCILPFIALNTNTDGAVNVCCKNGYYSLGNTRRNRLEEIWNCSPVKQLRKEFLDGKRPPSCHQCWDLEDKGGHSYREDVNRYYERFANEALKRVDKTTGEMPFEVKFIEIKISSLCNLACKMCVPSISSKMNTLWDKEFTKILHRQTVIDTKGVQNAYDDFDKLLEDIRTLAPHIEVLSLAGGEPLMEERFVDVFEALGDHKGKINLSIITNLSKLRHGRFDIIPEFKKFKRVTVVLSIDGTPAITQYIRTYSDPLDVQRNAQKLMNATTNVSLVINSAISALNIMDYGEAISWYIRNIQPEWLSNSMVDNFHLNINVLPTPYKKQAAQKIQDFLNYTISELPLSLALFNHVQQQCKSMINVLNDPYRDLKGWQEFKQFIAKFDVKCNSNVFDLLPDLKQYWDV